MGRHKPRSPPPCSALPAPRPAAQPPALQRGATPPPPGLPSAPTVPIAVPGELHHRPCHLQETPASPSRVPQSAGKEPRSLTLSFVICLTKRGVCLVNVLETRHLINAQPVQGGKVGQFSQYLKPIARGKSHREERCLAEPPASAHGFRPHHRSQAVLGGLWRICNKKAR